MKKTILTLSILFFLILQSCNNKPDCCPIPVEDIETKTPDTIKNNTTTQVSVDKINFNDLKVGQTSVYVRQETANWRRESETPTLTTDTIQLKIVSQDELGFKVEEWRFNSYPNNNNYYYFKIINNSLQVTPISIPNFSLFFVPQGQHILTFNEQVLQKWVLNKWLIPSSLRINGNSQGFIDSVTVNGIRYGKTFGRFDVSLVPTDGPIFVQLYSKSAGFISFQTLGYIFTTGGDVWTLIP